MKEVITIVNFCKKNKNNISYPIEEIKLNFAQQDKNSEKENKNTKYSLRFSIFSKEKIKEKVYDKSTFDNNNMELVFSSKSAQKKYLNVVLDFPEVFALSDHKTLGEFEISRNDNSNIEIRTDKMNNFKEFFFYLHENDLISKFAYQEFESYFKKNGFDKVSYKPK